MLAHQKKKKKKKKNNYYHRLEIVGAMANINENPSYEPHDK